MKLFGRLLAYAAAFVLLLLLAGWLAFVPSVKEPAYHFVTAWGEKGDAPGQFNDPTGIAVTADEVFVADSRNGRIQVFDHDGRFLRSFGSPGDGAGELGRPMNLTVHDGLLYVPEYFNDRIQLFTLQGESVALIGEAGDGPGQFSAPGGVAIADNGDILVSDFYNHRVQRLSPDGAYIDQWGDTGDIGIGAGEFNYPTDVAVGPDGTIHIADGYNDRIQAYDRDGAVLFKRGGPFAMNIFGPFRGWFAAVTGVATDPDGAVFAADFYNDRIQKFSSDGTFLTAFGESGSGKGQFNHAIAVDVAPDGTVFAVDFLNSRVQKWIPDADGD